MIAGTDSRNPLSKHMDVVLIIFAVVIVFVLLNSALRQSDRRDNSFSALSVETDKWSLELLRSLEWKKFEMVCSGYFEAIGFRAETTRAGADAGIDIHLFAKGAKTPGIIVQCKAWNTYKVGIKPIRELFGVMAKERVAEGIFLTTGDFTNEARSFHVGSELTLWNGQTLLEKIVALPAPQRDQLLRLATKGDFTTPSCPSCAVKMVSRSSRKDGSTFWGCRNYPRCRQTFKMK